MRVDLADAIEALRERLVASTAESAEAVRSALAETRAEVASTDFSFDFQDLLFHRVAQDAIPR